MKQSITVFLDAIEDVGVPCRGQFETWWTSSDPIMLKEASRSCHESCPALVRCWAYADSTNQTGGVWGGWTQKRWEEYRHVKEQGKRKTGRDEV